MTAPRGITQPPTSFIGSQCQGIHHAPLNTYNTKPKNESPTHTPPKSRTACGHQKNLHYMRRQPTQRNHPPHREAPLHASHHLDARNHYPQIKHHTPPPKRGNNKNPQPPEQTPGSQEPAPTPQQEQARGLVVSKPNSVSDDSSKQCSHTTSHVCCAPNPAHYRQRVPHGIRCDPLPQPFSWCSLERR